MRTGNSFIGSCGMAGRAGTPVGTGRAHRTQGQQTLPADKSRANAGYPARFPMFFAFICPVRTYKCGDSEPGGRPSVISYRVMRLSLTHPARPVPVAGAGSGPRRADATEPGGDGSGRVRRTGAIFCRRLANPDKYPFIVRPIYHPATTRAGGIFVGT